MYNLFSYTNILLDYTKIINNIALRLKDNNNDFDIHNYYLIDIGAGDGSLITKCFNYVNSFIFSLFCKENNIINFMFHFISLIGENLNDRIEKTG